jgi:hypothetical protein
VKDRLVSFQGLDTEASPTGRDPALLQVDEGSNHDQQGVWRPRRGWEKANVSNKTDPIRAVVGLELMSGDYVAVLATQPASAAGSMFSEAAFDE